MEFRSDAYGIQISQACVFRIEKKLQELTGFTKKKAGVQAAKQGGHKPRLSFPRAFTGPSPGTHRPAKESGKPKEATRSCPVSRSPGK